MILGIEAMLWIITLLKRFLFVFTAPCLVFLLSINASVQAKMPPGLSPIEGIKDPFSIPFPTKRRQDFLKSHVFNQTVAGSKTELIPINDIEDIYALAITAQVKLNPLSSDQPSLIRVILVDIQRQWEYLVYEVYPFLTDKNEFTIEETCEETCVFKEAPITDFALKIVVKNAAITISHLAYDDQFLIGGSSQSFETYKQNHDAIKIKTLNEKNLGWIAGVTSVSRLSYNERSQLFLTPDANNFYGLEFYESGVFNFFIVFPDWEEPGSIGASSILVDNFDWKNRHGENWMTPVKNQSQPKNCASCWAFATVGAVEAVTNLYFNQHLDLDLSEQQGLSCSGAGNCQKGGFLKNVLDYFEIEGIVNESCFPYTAIEEACNIHKGCSTESIDLITPKVQIEFDPTHHSEQNLKKMIIEHGPLSSALESLKHGMVLVGFEKDPSDNKTIWIFKNSYGQDWGENGYAKIKTRLKDIFFAYALQTPIQSLQPYSINCIDKDGDQFCHWGISKARPSTCPDFCKQLKDCDDSNPNLGPFDDSYNCKVINEIAVDTDNDGVPDSEDRFPEASSEWEDTDNDGQGNNADRDDDNDGVFDTEDTFPLNSTEWEDTDRDGQGNNADLDDDNDTILDEDDVFPLDPEESEDSDEDLMGNNYEFKLLYLNPYFSGDADFDPDGNGCTNLQEFQRKQKGLPVIIDEVSGMNAEGKVVGTLTTFRGGISVNSNACEFQPQAILTLSGGSTDWIDVRGVIAVDEAHVGQLADIVVYVGYTLPNSSETLFYMITENRDILQWLDKNPATLVPFSKDIRLLSEQVVDIHNDELELAGTIQVFWGYRLKELPAPDVLIFNKKPLEIVIK